MGTPVTVVLVTPDGRLADVRGRNKEGQKDSTGKSTRLGKLASRLLGSEGTANSSRATLDYGWNGNTKLVISKGGVAGDEVSVLTALLSVSGDLEVGGKRLQTLIDESIDFCLEFGIIGANGISVDVTTGEEGQPRKILTIGLDAEFRDRIASLERTVDGLLRTESAIVVGDGLKVDRTDRNRLSVRAGGGLTFTGTGAQKDLSVDVETSVVPLSNKPVTSGAVYAAIHAGPPDPSAITLAKDENGNICAVFREDDSSSGSSDSSDSSDSPESSG